MGFNRWEKRTLKKIIDVFYPPGVGERLKRGAEEAGAAEKFEFMVSNFPIETRILFHFIIWLVYWLPVISLKYPLPFNFLNWEKRKKVMEKMFYSKNYYIRSLASLFKLISSVAFFADPEARKQVGIPDINDPIYQKYMGG